jgi:hypothetical protein
MNIRNNELKFVWKEVVAEHFKDLFRNLPEHTEEIHEKNYRDYLYTSRDWTQLSIRNTSFTASVKFPLYFTSNSVA